MAGPGGREVGRVSVRVVPDTSKFAADLRSDLEALERRLEVKIPTKFDVQTKGLNQRVKAATVAAQAAAKDIELQVDVDRGHLNRQAAVAGRQAGQVAGKSFGDGFGRSIRPRTALIVSAIAAITAFSPQLLVLASSLLQVVGALALAPALLGGIGVAVGVVAIGSAVLGDALARLTEDQALFNEALVGMPKATADFARGLRAIADAMAGISDVVGKNLFAGLAAQLRDIAENLIPKLRAGLVTVAQGVNVFLGGVLGAIAAIGRTRDLEDTFNNIGLAMEKLGPFGRAVVNIFNDLGVVGSQFLPPLADALSRAATSFAGFIEEARKSGDLERWIRDALETIETLGEVAANAYRFIRLIMEAAGNAGGGTLGALGDAMERLVEIVGRPEFQSGLTAFFSGLNLFMVGLGPGIKALGSAIGEIAPILGEFLSELGPVLGEAIASIAPQLPGLVDAFAQILTAVLPLVPALADLAAQALPLLVDLLVQLVPLLEQVVPLLVQMFAAATADPAFGAGIILLTQILALSAQWKNLLLELIPLIGQFAYMTGFGLGSALAAAVGVITTSINAIALAVQFGFGLALTIVQTTMSAIVAAVTFLMGAARTAVQVNVTGITAAIGFLAALPGMVAGYFARVIAAVQNAMASAAGAAQAGISRILGLFAGLGGRLYAAGYSLISGFASGIRAGIGAAVSAASSALQAVRNLFPFSPAKEGPFSGRGWTLYSGQAIGDALARGMLSRIGTVHSAASSLVGAAAAGGTFGAAPSLGGVRVFIGDQELRGMVRTEVSEGNRETKRRATAVAR